MSARRFARDVPRAVQHAVRAAIELADDNGEVVGGLPALQQALGHDTDRATRAVVSQAEGLRLLRRVGHASGQTGARRLFVVESRLVPSACETPGCGLPPVRGRWCGSCRQVRRADRAWVHRAVDLVVAGNGLSVVASILSRPLMPDVVFAVASEVPALVDAAWIDALREHSPDHVRRLTDRTRQRRAESRRRDDRLVP